jgi:hypothetical protein
MSYSVDKIKPKKFDDEWTVTADLRSLETFEDYNCNYTIVEKLKENKVLSDKTSEDSESCQFFAYFKTKQSADNFVKRLAAYVEKRKQLINSL